MHLLRLEFGGKRGQALSAPADSDHAVARTREAARDRGTEPGRRTRDDNDHGLLLRETAEDTAPQALCADLSATGQPAMM
jgi:hypothetical protein